jgi:hypothetical protein
VSQTTYRIYSNKQEVTSALTAPITDETQAKATAQEVSRGQPGSLVEVVSVGREPSGEWTRVVAAFIDGKPHPWQWEVTFHGYLEGVDHLRLNEAGITYVSGGSEVKDGALRAGIARHRLIVEATDGRGAVDKVREVLGPLAAKMSDWTHEPADDGQAP